MSEVTREEFNLVVEKVAKLGLWAMAHGWGHEPERTFDPAPTVEIAPPPTQQHPAVDFPRGVFALLCDQLAADLGPEGLDKLQEGVVHYFRLYQAMHPETPVTEGEMAKAWTVVFPIGTKFEKWQRSLAGDTIRECLLASAAKGVDEPKVWNEHPFTHERRLVGIPAESQWLAKEEAALHTGGSGQLSPTPVKPKK